MAKSGWKPTIIDVSWFYDVIDKAKAEEAAKSAARIVALEAEVKRLKWRLNHQTEDDVEACRQGKHRDCGAHYPPA